MSLFKFFSMLSDEEAKFLIALISDEDEPLGQLYNKFTQKYDMKAQILCINALSCLLGDGILEYSQQFVAFWIIYRAYYHEDYNMHPYKMLFSLILEQHQIRQESCSSQLYATITNIITNTNVLALDEFSVTKIFSELFPFYANSINDIPHSKMLNMRCSPLIVEPDQEDNENISLNAVLEKLITSPEYLNEFEPPTIHTAPDIFPITDNEVNQLIITSTNTAPPLFDESHSAETIKVAHNLIVEAPNRVLNNREIQTLNSLIFSDSSFLTEDDINEQNFSKISETNPEIAILLIKALPSERQKFSDILSRAPAGPGVATTVKKFVLENLAPSGFIRAFFTSTTTAIRGVKDNTSAARIGRPFCEVLIELIESGVKIDGSLTISLTSLCDDMRKFNIKEATTLQSLLSAD